VQTPLAAETALMAIAEQKKQVVSRISLKRVHLVKVFIDEIEKTK
jgi:hypothetical protein